MQDGNTALIVAINRGHCEAALILIQHGADVNSQKKVGMVTCAPPTSALLNKTSLLQIAVSESPRIANVGTMIRQH